MPVSKRSFQVLFLILSVFALLWLNQGDHGAEHKSSAHEVILQSFIWFAVAMVLARAVASLFRLINIPTVLGCITAGIIAGNFSLMTGLDWLEPIKTTEFIHIIAEYAVVLLLFKIGLESNIDDILSVGLRSLAVAIVGVVAYSVGLEMIVGAYAVGLALDPVHFRYFKEPEAIMELRERLLHTDTKCEKESMRILEATIDKHSDKHIEELIHGFVIFIVPVFFFYTGMQVDLGSLVANPTILGIALAVSVAAIIGKYISGWAAGPGVDRNTVGWAMVPRGEVGIVFANVGLSLGVLSADLFATVIIMVVVTTFAAPIVLAYRLSHKA
jgi:Kef-type K+ transport system membrane component KefB